MKFFNENRFNFKVKNYILTRSNFYVSVVINKDSIEMRLRGNSIKTRIETNSKLENNCLIRIFQIKNFGKGKICLVIILLKFLLPEDWTVLYRRFLR